MVRMCEAEDLDAMEREIDGAVGCRACLRFLPRMCRAVLVSRAETQGRLVDVDMHGCYAIKIIFKQFHGFLSIEDPTENLHEWFSDPS